MWKVVVPPKLRHFWWKVCVNAIASKENLWRRNCGSDPTCPRCKKEIESVEHIVFRCSFISSVWGEFLKIDSSLFGNDYSALKWTDELISNGGQFFYLIISIC